MRRPCYNSSLLVNMKGLDRLESFLFKLFWRRAPIPSALPGRRHLHAIGHARACTSKAKGEHIKKRNKNIKKGKLNVKRAHLDSTFEGLDRRNEKERRIREALWGVTQKCRSQGDERTLTLADSYNLLASDVEHHKAIGSGRQQVVQHKEHTAVLVNPPRKSHTPRGDRRSSLHVRQPFRKSGMLSSLSLFTWQAPATQ